MRRQTQNFALYTPLLPGSTPLQAVPQIVVFKGTDSVFNLLLDVQLFRDQTATQFNSVLLESFYTEVKALADVIADNAEGRDIVMTGHSLGAFYATSVYARLLQDHPGVAAEVVAVETFNPYILHDESYAYLKNQPIAVRSVIKHHIIEGDFASVLVLDGAVGEVDMYGADAVAPIPDEEQFSAFGTLREYAQSFAAMDFTQYTSLVVAHRMANWTDLTPTEVYQTVPVDLGTINLMYFHTAAQSPIPQRGIITNAPLYLAPFEKVDMSTSSTDTMLVRVQVPDETAFLIQQDGADRYLNWQMLVSHDGDLSSEPVLRPIYNGRDSIGNAKMFFVSIITGQALRLSSTLFADLGALPAALEKVDLTDLNADAANGTVSRYEFVHQPYSPHSERRGTMDVVPDMMNKAIGFTFNSVIANFDTYDIRFNLYDTGGGILKWGHIDVGDRDNYKIDLPHNTGDEYYVHSNTYDATTAMYTPSFELVKYDTNRYTIRNTDVLNNGKYLKRPSPSYTYLNHSQTSAMMYGDNTQYFIDMEWDLWDGITGSPDDYLFDIEAFDQLQIPTRLGNVLTNYDADGTLVKRELKYPQYMKSTSGQYTLTFQRDGNLALFQDDSTVIYTSNTHNAGNSLTLQSDGNAVIYSGGTRDANVAPPVYWASGTGGGKINFHVTNTGKLVITDDQDNDLWSRPT